MVLGLTRSELGLVVFIFALVYAAGHLPKLVSLVSRLVGGPRDGTNER